MYVLGIETSCDETAVAIYHAEKGLISHILHSQIPIHNDYGGVVRNWPRATTFEN